MTIPVFEQHLLELHVGRQASDKEGVQLAAVTSRSGQVDTRDQSVSVAQPKVDGGVGVSTLAETAPDSSVLGARTVLRQRFEVEKSLVGKENNVGGDHHCRLAGPVRALQRSNAGVENIALVEDAAPIDQRKLHGYGALHSFSSSSSSSDSSAIPTAIRFAKAFSGRGCVATGSANRRSGTRSRS